MASLAPSWLQDHLPQFLWSARLAGLEPWQWLGVLGALGAAYAGGVLLAGAALRLADRVAKRTTTDWDDALLRAVRGPLRAILALVLLNAALAPLALPPAADGPLQKYRAAVLVIAFAWLATRLLGVLSAVGERLLTRGVADEGRVRGVHTVVVVVRRVASVAIGVVALALVLSQFEVARHVGSALLASAGVATVIGGLAAQKSLSSLLAGIQIAITQPVRVGDTVIVENEWGWIEEISFSYVVVKVWDLRRLVVPISYFLEKPFQNWTKAAADIMGTVEIPADFTVPVARVREELSRCCRENKLWDGKVCGLQVTATSERSITLRALVSSSDAGKNWDLRCDVREALVTYLQNLEGGRYLPRTRVDAGAEGARDSGVRAAGAA